MHCTGFEFSFLLCSVCILFIFIWNLGFGSYLQRRHKRLTTKNCLPSHFIDVHTVVVPVKTEKIEMWTVASTSLSSSSVNYVFYLFISNCWHCDPWGNGWANTTDTLKWQQNKPIAIVMDQLLDTLRLQCVGITT